MGDSSELKVLIESAALGDRCAMDRLLLREYEPLLVFIRSRMPARLASRLSPEDLLQDSLVRAARGIQKFDTARPDGFRSWLHTIAQNVIHDARKQHAAARRDGRREVGASPALADESIIGLLDLLPITGRTPSQSVARRDAVVALRVALSSIPSDYGQAIRLRYLEGLSIAETAERMGRTNRAIQMLCNRGLKSLAAAMGSASMYLSRTA